MAGGIDQVELVLLAIAGGVVQGRGLGLDGNPALTLQVHGIKDLRFHFTIGQAAAQLDDAVSQSRLAVVDVGDDGKVADVLHVPLRRRGKNHGFPLRGPEKAETTRARFARALIFVMNTLL